MKLRLVATTWLIFMQLFGGFVVEQAEALPRRHSHIPHILPDASSEEYYALSVNMPAFRGNSTVQYAMKLGERNMLWLKHMNSLRPEGQKIQLTKPGQLKGVPIDTPSKYSVETIQTDYDQIYRDMPVELAKILYSTAPFLDNPPIAEADYVFWAKKVDRNYQTATRWAMMEPYLQELSENRVDDLRGYYFLSRKTANVEEVLNKFSSAPLDDQNKIKSWLIQMCVNNEGLKSPCDSAVNQAIQNGNLFQLYSKYLPGSEKLWNAYFSLVNPRPEIEWSFKDPSTMMVPFKDPGNDPIKNFLVQNIEDEFRWDQWNLRLNVIPKAPVHVIFQPGVTPHVNGAGGDTITMDDNSPLTEWDTQWTIRHEFGHVLGFVDCYLEFYDPSEKAIINYQLDVDHLMCSRAGKMQKSIFDTLKSFYFK